LSATCWIEVYGPLSHGEEGLLGAATRRAAAHVVRLAAIYATLDCAEQITPPHLEAALAVWRYSLDSARWIFGDSIGDPTADEIWALAKDRPHGINRSEVRDLFGRNKKAREIDRALTVLEEAGRHDTHQPSRRPRTARRALAPARRLTQPPHGRLQAPSRWTWADHRAGRPGLSRAKRGESERSDLDSPAAGATIIQVQGRTAQTPAPQPPTGRPATAAHRSTERRLRSHPGVNVSPVALHPRAVDVRARHDVQMRARTGAPQRV